MNGYDELNEGEWSALWGQCNRYALPDYREMINEELEMFWISMSDARAGNELMKRVQRQVANVVRYRLYRRRGEPFEACELRREEAVQEVMYRVANRLLDHGYDRMRDVLIASYVGNLVNGYLLHWLRSERSWVELDSVSPDGYVLRGAEDEAQGVCPQVLRVSGPDPLEHAEMGMAADEIKELLGEMSPKMQQCFYDVAVAGLSVREAAARCGVHYSRVSVHANAAAEQIARRLAARHGGEWLHDLSGHESEIAVRLAR